MLCQCRFISCNKCPTLVITIVQLLDQTLQSLSRIWLFATTCTATYQVSLFFIISQSLLKLISIESAMLSNYLILFRPLLLLPSIFPSIRIISNESVLRIRWPKYWSFRFSISPSKECLELISFRIHWLDLLAIQGTLKSPLQHHSSKASILWCSAFFIIQFLYPYLTNGKSIALIRQSFVSKAMSLLCNKTSIAFLPRSKCLLILWLQYHLQWFWSPRK